MLEYLFFLFISLLRKQYVKVTSLYLPKSAKTWQLPHSDVKMNIIHLFSFSRCLQIRLSHLPNKISYCANPCCEDNGNKTKNMYNCLCAEPSVSRFRNTSMVVLFLGPHLILGCTCMTSMSLMHMRMRTG